MQSLPGIQGLHAQGLHAHIESLDNMYITTKSARYSRPACILECITHSVTRQHVQLPVRERLACDAVQHESNSCLLEVEVNKLNKVFGLHTQGVPLCSRQNTFSVLRQMEISVWICQMCLSLDLSLTIIELAHS